MDTSKKSFFILILMNTGEKMYLTFIVFKKLFYSILKNHET